MRLTAATVLLALTGAVLHADDAPALKAGLRTADDKKADKKPDDKKADDKKADDKKADNKAPARPQVSRADRLKNVIDGYKSNCASWVDAYRREDEEKDKEMLLKNLPNPAPYAGQAARLVLEDPKDEVAFDALLWLVRYQDTPDVKKVLTAVPAPRRGDKPGQLDVFAALLEHHIDNPKLATLARGLYEHTPATEAFLESLVAKAKDATIRGFAGVQLADMLGRKSEDADMPNALRAKFVKEAESILTKLAADQDVMKVVVFKDPTGKEHTLGDNIPGDLRAVRELSIGKPIPALTGRDLNDKSVSPADYKGKVLVLDVWATWCGPCRAMIPHEREMTARLKDKPFALVSVSFDEKKETLTEFLEKEKMPWTHWWNGQKGPLNKELNIRFFPTIYVIDARGTIRYKNIRGEKLEAAVNKLLKEMEGAASGGQ